MKHAVAVVDKLKRLGHKMLMSAGYVDSGGNRRKSPPLVVKGES